MTSTEIQKTQKLDELHALYQNIIRCYLSGNNDLGFSLQKIDITQNAEIYLVETKEYRFCLKVHLKPEYFHRESSILHSCYHPNIVRFYFSIDFFETYNLGFIIMEWLDIYIGFKSLNRNEKIITELLYDVMKAIYYLHKRNIVHGDIKLENIIGQLQEGKVVHKLIDFNLSEKLNDSNELIKSSRGTFEFIAPEVFNKSQFTAKSDIYSLGACGYILLHGYEQVKSLFSSCKIKECYACVTLSDKAQKKNCKMCYYQLKCRICSKVKVMQYVINIKNNNNENVCICMKTERYHRIWSFNQKSIHSFNPDKSLLHKFIKMCLEPIDTRKDIDQLINDQITKDLFRDMWDKSEFKENLVST